MCNARPCTAENRPKRCSVGTAGIEPELILSQKTAQGNILLVEFPNHWLDFIQPLVELLVFAERLAIIYNSQGGGSAIRLRDQPFPVFVCRRAKGGNKVFRLYILQILGCVPSSCPHTLWHTQTT